MSKEEKTYPWKYICFSGGGFKGFSYIGVIKYFENHHPTFLRSVVGFSGTSIGALMALGLVLGCTSDQILTQIDKNLSDIKSISNHSIAHLFERGYCSSPEVTLKLIQSLLNDHIGKSNMTFSELYKWTGKELSFCTVNITLKKIEYHNRLTTPDLKISESCTASMAYPGVFPPVTINNNQYLDGGILENLPFKIYPAEETLSFYLCSEQDLVYKYYQKNAVVSSNTVSVEPLQNNTVLLPKLAETFKILYDVFANIAYGHLELYNMKRCTDSTVAKSVIWITVDPNQSTIKNYPTENEQKKMIECGFEITRSFFPQMSKPTGKNDAEALILVEQSTKLTDADRLLVREQFFKHQIKYASDLLHLTEKDFAEMKLSTNLIDSINHVTKRYRCISCNSTNCLTNAVHMKPCSYCEKNHIVKICSICQASFCSKCLS